MTVPVTGGSRSVDEETLHEFHLGFFSFIFTCNSSPVYFAPLPPPLALPPSFSPSCSLTFSQPSSAPLPPPHLMGRVSKNQMRPTDATPALRAAPAPCWSFGLRAPVTPRCNEPPGAGDKIQALLAGYGTLAVVPCVRSPRSQERRPSAGRKALTPECAFEHYGQAKGKVMQQRAHDSQVPALPLDPTVTHKHGRRAHKCLYCCASKSSKVAHFPRTPCRLFSSAPNMSTVTAWHKGLRTLFLLPKNAL